MNDTNGANICATCPSNCCKNCAEYLGYFGPWEIRRPFTGIPLGLLEFISNIKEKRVQKCSTSKYEYLDVRKIDNDYLKSEVNKLNDCLSYDTKFNKETGFLTSKGCSLKREHRSGTCLNYRCDTLKFAVNSNLVNSTYKEVESKMLPNHNNLCLS